MGAPRTSSTGVGVDSTSTRTTGTTTSTSTITTTKNWLIRVLAFTIVVLIVLFEIDHEYSVFYKLGVKTAVTKSSSSSTKSSTTTNNNKMMMNNKTITSTTTTSINITTATTTTTNQQLLLFHDDHNTSTNQFDYLATVEFPKLLRYAETAKQNSSSSTSTNHPTMLSCPNNGLPTSLNYTVNAMMMSHDNNGTGTSLSFSQSSHWPIAKIWYENDNDQDKDCTEQHQDEGGIATTTMIPIDFIFRAYNIENKPQPIGGGDLFVMDFQAWYNITVTKDSIDTDSDPPTVGVVETKTIIPISFRTAAYSQDQLDGTYLVALHLPAELASAQYHHDHHQQPYYNLKLRHYYTCWEGTKTTVQLEGRNGHHNIYMGPEIVNLDETSSNNLWYTIRNGTINTTTEEDDDEEAERIKKSTDNNIQKQKERTPPPPLCTATQQGVDEIGKGIWLEQGLVFPNELTLDAKWVPLYCRIPNFDKKVNCKVAGNSPSPSSSPPPVTTVKHLRMGDSTMPGTPWGQIGVPFIPFETRWKTFLEHHDKYVSVLWNELNNHDDDDETMGGQLDTFLLSHGLWYIFHAHFNSITTADLVLRCICQIALRFPGKMIVQGVVPIQQHQFHKVDISSQNIQILNSILRRRIRHVYHHRLDEICINRDDLHVFVSLPNQTTGDEVVPRESLAADLINTAYPNFRYNVTTNTILPPPDDEVKLIEWISNLSLQDKQHIYGNRTIWYTDCLESLLLSRPETYRVGDKIHDLRPMGGGKSMMNTYHTETLKIVELLRSLGPE